MKFNQFTLLLFFSIIGLFKTMAYEPPVKDQPLFSVFFIGDAGNPNLEGPDPTLELLTSELNKAGKESAVVFLGDNIYPRGLPPENNRHRTDAEQRMLRLINVVEGYPGKVIFTPGNHDWQGGGKSGWEYILQQEEFVELKLNFSNTFLPDLGCAGPVEVPLDDDILLVIIDTQWLLHPWDKPRKMDDGCEAESSTMALDFLEDIVMRNPHKRIIVSSHHPVYTYGMHGGVTTFRQHLFPLTDASKALYIPLPIIGSIYPLYRKYIGHIQDTAHPKYKLMRKRMEEIFNLHPNLIHVSGHEHSLQYSYKDSIHFIVSGAGSKTTHVKEKEYARFVKEAKGFSKITFFNSGITKHEFYSAEEENHILDSRILFDIPLGDSEENISFSIDEKETIASASKDYLRKKSYHWMLGANYRDVWAAESRFPVFNIGSEKGGLKIIKRGGGKQTKSLRLQNKNGRQYVLRSLQKYPAKAIPIPLRETLAAKLVQDQISASHPYGAFVVPDLAQAVNIYHTNPICVYIPDDPRFGIYQSDFANTLCLFEERPAGDWSDSDLFGSSEKIYSTPKVLEKLYENNDNFVDQHWTLKSRLFDMLIGDLDRHDDQWRWSSFDAGRGKVFRPIPRDRDQAFFKGEGFLMNIVTRKWMMPELQGFDYELKNPPGFMFSGQYFDRDFLNMLSRDDWNKAVDSLQDGITDEVIEASIKQWPDTIFNLSGETIISKLKTQRNKLRKYAIEYYDFLAKGVDVRGTNKRELFEVTRMDDDLTNVKVFKIKDGEKDKLIYHRIFYANETSEIRLYGLGGKDIFNLSGDVHKGIRIRIIGGPNEDIIDNRSNVRGLKKHTYIYDTKGENVIEFGKDAKDKTSNNPGVNSYVRNSFEYNKLAPLLYINYNADDKLFLGAGFFFKNHGFRKHPFKSQHRLMGSHSIATASWNFIYNGVFTDVLGKADFKVNLLSLAPNYVTNFFGLGNESEYDRQANEKYNVEDAIDYYRTRFRQHSVELLLDWDVFSKSKFSLGYHWQGFQVYSDYGGEDRFILDYADSISDDNFFKFKTYHGAALLFRYDTRNNIISPSSGIDLSLDLRGYQGLNTASDIFTNFTGYLTLYQMVRLPSELTFAIRFGAGHNFGKYEFFQGQVLSGHREIRGYRRTRFIGDTKVYLNNEARLKIATIPNRVLPMTIGINGFFDIGRVRLSGDHSNVWHYGYGGGIWLAPLDIIVTNFEIAQSDEGVLFYFRVGYFF